jgi:hypothetical protein
LGVTVENVTGLIIAVTGLIAAIGVLVVQVKGLRKDINGRLTQLLEAHGEAQRKEGELAGRDYVTTPTRVSVMGGAGTPVPLVPHDTPKTGGPSAARYPFTPRSES